MRMLLVVGVLACVAGCASDGAKDTPQRAVAALPDKEKNAANAYLVAVSDTAKLLSGVTDTNGARAAMPRLEQLISSIGASFNTLATAAPEPRRNISVAFGEQLRLVNESFAAQVNRIKGTAGLGNILGPLLDKIQLFRG